MSTVVADAAVVVVRRRGRRRRRRRRRERTDRLENGRVRVLRDEQIPAGHDQIRIVERPTVELAPGVGLPQRRPCGCRRRTDRPQWRTACRPARLARPHPSTRRAPAGRRVPVRHDQLPAGLDGLRGAIEHDPRADLTPDVGVDDLAPTRAVAEHLFGDAPQRVVAHDHPPVLGGSPHPGRRSRSPPRPRCAPSEDRCRRGGERSCDSEDRRRPHRSCRRVCPSTP